VADWWLSLRIVRDSYPFMTVALVQDRYVSAIIKPERSRTSENEKL